MLQLPKTLAMCLIVHVRVEVAADLQYLSLS